MKLTIGTKTYTKLTNLKFDPTADVTGNSVPINEFSVDIKTTDNIDAMQYAWLYNDIDTLFAKYWIVYADRMDAETVSIKAQSSLKLLERRMLDAKMFENEPIEDIIADIFDELGASSYALDEAFEGVTISNFAPNQSAKNRLQWVCFVLGAYIKSFFGEKIEILPVGDDPKMIPPEKTDWKPSLTYAEYRTRISVTAYSYEEGAPETTDSWVEADGTVYIQTQLNHGLRNTDVPTGTLTHETRFADITLVNNDNVDDILTRLGPFYFKRVTVEMDVINNGEFIPGDYVYFYTAENEMGLGYIESADFSFGTQSKSRLKITPVDVVPTAPLTVKCIYDEREIARFQYVLPINYAYDIELPALDQLWGSTRFVFVAEDATITGTVSADGSTVEADYILALGSEQGTLLVRSVDEYDLDGGTVSIS